MDTYRTRYRWKPDGNLIDLKLNLWATDVEETASSVGPAFYLPPYITPQNHPPASRHALRQDMDVRRRYLQYGPCKTPLSVNSNLGTARPIRTSTPTDRPISAAEATQAALELLSIRATDGARYECLFFGGVGCNPLAEILTAACDTTDSQFMTIERP